MTTESTPVMAGFPEVGLENRILSCLHNETARDCRLTENQIRQRVDAESAPVGRALQELMRRDLVTQWACPRTNLLVHSLSDLGFAFIKCGSACPTCGRICADETARERHMRRHHPTSWINNAPGGCE